MGSPTQQVVQDGSVTTGRRGGTVVWTGGRFTALTDILTASNRDLACTFTGHVAGAPIPPRLLVTLRSGLLHEVLLTSGTQDLRCGPTATLNGQLVPAGN